MDFNSIIQIIGTLGFPIAACVAMAWYVKYTVDKYQKQFDTLTKAYQEQVAKITEEHRIESNKMTEALANNTLAIQQLSMRLENLKG